MTDRTNQALSEALAILEIQHEKSEVEGKRDWYTRSGEFIGSYDAFEGWEKLKQITAMVEAQRAA